MNEKPWYHEGLKFRCTGCGNCCTGDPGIVWVSEEELADIAHLMGTSIGEVRLLHTRLFGGRLALREFANGDCTFFDAETRRCTVYCVRPLQCRSWPFWRSNLKSEKIWKHVQRTCPGAGSGALVSLEEIEAKADRVDH